MPAATSVGNEDIAPPEKHISAPLRLRARNIPPTDSTAPWGQGRPTLLRLCARNKIMPAATSVGNEDIAPPEKHISAPLREEYPAHRFHGAMGTGTPYPFAPLREE